MRNWRSGGGRTRELPKNQQMEEELQMARAASRLVATAVSHHPGGAPPQHESALSFLSLYFQPAT
jgi:hypothetical protein